MFINLYSNSDDQMPPKITSIFNTEYFFPRDFILTDAFFSCRAQNGHIRYVRVKWFNTIMYNLSITKSVLCLKSLKHFSDIILYIFMIFSLSICRYEWNKDGNAVQNSQFVSIDKSTGTLKFIKMQNEDYGTYQCFATNKYGTSISVPLKVKESSKFLLTSFKW